ncbi:ABC transporter ATP-binding protein [Paraburkholderia fungorum]|jgi:ATP-binding cassette subfamily B protein|uniref:ABC transporter ATP-binding protein/permease n=1 Tax=Paraburkholderia fungorum TaxID=134537 RepID=A0AAP1KR78_9BURK|nr:ABC transporter ATP-binding protein [Paraburkholderia fungorum]KFX63794.1 multidrug ABC transporter ATPase [Burkholderia sp. K24]MBB4511901.1 ATP-binding cassette subfamily B protein [Paraburkholderia fungorum]MBB6199807.1 ATP-binding cassette subfamily B protein [Paraburkholderia fungorum]MBU7436566.1 ABC transporter ATP-binding protein/permease [Paraburkholderia fungorum]MDT8836272.1 ABC transporter ATP-binding protein/permease [Paraburkholderia fungorum]
MTRKKLDLRGHAFRNVLGFTFRHWAKQPWRICAITALVLLSALADVLTPMFAGRLVDAIASGSAGDALAWRAAITAFCVLSALGLGAELLRQGVFFNLIRLTLKMMSEIASNAFHRVQRFSTDWHANSFAGSTVRKITRGMWALDLLNDTLLVALLPSVVMLVGSTVLLGWRWPMMGAVVGVGSVLYIAVTVIVSLGFVAPAARLANAWDTRMGGALADAVSCNGVVKAFGAEEREEALLDRVIVKWRHRTRRTWIRGTINGGLQGGMLVAIQAAILGAALLLWMRGEASVGDITFALTMFFMLQGYLRDVGMHIRNLQRSVNDMEELVQLESQPLGIEDRPGAGPIAIGKGEIRFEHVTFHYGAKATPLYENFSVRIAPGERVGLVGHSGSGKTTFIKLIQRLYDISEGRITIDGQDIARVRQASLRSQIAIVQQEPVLFHRSLAENIAYARPGASRAEIERAARLASAHDFIATLPQGYDTLVGERGIKLSGGERQRVAIARAFLADAPILILDEATSSLDSESEVLIQQAMERLMTGRTTLVVAHRLSTVRALDRLLVLDKGKVIEEGSHDALIRLENGLYRRLFERQALELIKGLGDSEVTRKTDNAKANLPDDSSLLVEK